MKATGIVRRIEACVIIGQTARNPHKHWGFSLVCPIERIGVKNGFLGGFRKEQNNVLNMRQKSIDLSSKNEIFKLSH